MPYLIGLSILASMGLYFLFPSVWLKCISRRLLKNHLTRNNALFLTFDDGPSDPLTSRILARLGEHGAKASFFVLGRNASAGRDMIKTIQRKHCICSHGYDHVHHWKVSPWRAIKDMEKGWAVLREVLGDSRSVFPFRPPYGKLNLITLIYLWIKNVPIAYWTFDAGDTWVTAPRFESVRKRIEFDPNQVFLLHDLKRSDENSERDEFVLSVTEFILTHARSKGIQIDTF